MPDAMARGARAPQDWGAAFAALPLAEPPGDGWARLAARLDARPHRRWPAWLALAAALLLAVALPWKLQQPAPPAVQPLASAHDPAAKTHRVSGRALRACGDWGKKAPRRARATPCSGARIRPPAGCASSVSYRPSAAWPG